jgi:ssRNA-specific RNase YbeY (16S rRNA maturation enzyme)
VHDLHATLLHLMGFDHEKLVFHTQGVNQRLSNITKSGTRVVTDILA